MSKPYFWSSLFYFILFVLQKKLQRGTYNYIYKTL